MSHTDNQFSLCHDNALGRIKWSVMSVQEDLKHAHDLNEDIIELKCLGASLLYDFPA